METSRSAGESARAALMVSLGAALFFFLCAAGLPGYASAQGQGVFLPKQEPQAIQEEPQDVQEQDVQEEPQAVGEEPQAVQEEPRAAGEQPPAGREGEFFYQSLGRRDPFKSLLVLQEKQKDTSKLPPIQQVDLTSFKVVGLIMDESSGNRAMIKAPDGKSYVIQKGDIVGKNEGEVLSINFDGITVKEKFLDYLDNETTVTTVLKVTEKLN